MKRALWSVGALGLLSLASATSAPRLSLDQQAVKAQVIVRATVEAPASVQESGQTWNVYPLTVLETLAGDAQALPKYQNKPSVWILSGMQDGPLLPGGEAMLLLYTGRYDSPLVGFNQGVYTVQGGTGGSKVVLGLPAGTPGVADAAPTPVTGTTTAGTPSTPPTAASASGTPRTPSGAAPAPTPTTPPPTTPSTAATQPPSPATPAPAAASSTAAPASPTNASPTPTTSTPAALAPGQMTLEAFRQAVLSARSKAGK